MSLATACQVGTYAWWPADDRLEWSPELLRLYGLETAPAAEEGFTRLVHPEDRVRVESETSAYLGSNATTYSHMFRIVRLDGSIRLMLDRGLIERDFAGAARVLRGMNVDLTELPEIDDARRLDAVSDRLKQSEARLDSALRSGGLGVHEFDPRTNTITWDATVCRIWGVPPGEPITLDTFADGIHQEDLAAVQAAVAAALDPEGSRHYEATYRVVHRRTRLVRWVHADGDVAFEGRTPVRLVGTVQDITERREIEERLRESEERLRRSELRFRQALAGSPITVFEHDADLRYRWLFNSKLGYEDTFCIGKTDAEIMEPAAAEVLTSLKGRVLESGRAERQEVVAAAPGQPLEYFDLHVHPQCDEAGRVTGLTGVATDITERRRSQHALDRTAAQLRRAARAAMFGVHEFDPFRQVARWSPEMGRILGVPADGPIPLDEVLATTHPLDRDRLRAEVAAIQRRIGPYEIEYRISRPDGDVRWLLDRGEAIGPIDPDSGLVASVTGTVIDITERKLAEEQLRAAHDTFRHLVDRSPFGVYVVDADFRLVQVSEGAQKVFQNVRPLIGRDFADVLRTIWPEPFASEAVGRFRHTLATGETYHAPATVEQRADIGETEAYDWKLERITLPDGRPGVVCHFYDLSERQRHEEQIRFLMLEVDHRSKNLLALIQAMARLTAPAEAGEFVRAFGHRLQALAAAHSLLVNNEWKAVPLAELVRSQLSHLSDLIDRRIAIVGPAIGLTPAAAQALGLALHELATNAAKHGALASDAGRVEIAWSLLDDAAGTTLFTLTWAEHGGPTVSRPQRRGFGTEVTTAMTRMSLGGEVTVDYAPGGLLWRIACPLGNIAEAR